jgi:L-threonylcarbamoyladenylate synthase
MPVVATSANISGRPPAVNGQTVLDELKDEIDMVIEGIEEPYGIESTILDVSMFPPRILRLGFISPDEIASVIGKQPIFSDNTGNISYSRFNPTSEIYVYSGEPQKIQAKIDFLTKEFPSKKILLVLLEETAKNINTVHPKKIYGSRSGIDKIASTLYETIRELENTKEEIIFIEGVPQTGIGLTIMNRFFAISDRTIR